MSSAQVLGKPSTGLESQAVLLPTSLGSGKEKRGRVPAMESRHLPKFVEIQDLSILGARHEKKTLCRLNFINF